MALLPPAKSLLSPLNVPQKLLMGPGPSNAAPRVLAAGMLPLLGHLHPEFQQIMNECKAGIQYAFQTKNPVTLAISGTGHAAMEAAVVNLVEPGDVVAIATNGIWGERFADMVGRHGGCPRPFSAPAGTVFSLADFEKVGGIANSSTSNKVIKALIAHKPQIMFVTHGESSACTCQPLEGIGALCHRYNCLLVVDSVAAMGGVPLYMDKWEIDLLYSGSQKVLSCPPGTGPISLSSAAWDKVQKRNTKVQSFYLDFNWLANYWGCDEQPRKYHHTGPISSIYALREGLAILAEEGLDKCWERHRRCAEFLHQGVIDLGLSFFVQNERDRLPTVTGVVVPPGVDWKQVTDYAMKTYKIEISGGLGPTAGRIWRIGLMGQNAREENASLVLKALKEGIEETKRLDSKSRLMTTLKEEVEQSKKEPLGVAINAIDGILKIRKDPVGTLLKAIRDKLEQAQSKGKPTSKPKSKL